ncbi:MAG: thiamine pyrophosphate-dependent dehydrogenase E1 component subunit alpha, partial [Candidatus Azambacteria bacterium]|nr:thiamine pyrophosphate-dependent dehydrogenase E1 component subunit alpha [Candidatus Azambacteria bacterium]
LSIGQEAVAVGVMAALKPQDKIVSTHRCHGHYLAKGGDLKKMMAEILGKATGCCKGKGGTMHLFDDSVGHVISAPLVAASISFAVGLALSFKMKGEDKIAVAFFGDGAVEEGIFWESINFASVHRLPVLFICENNLYATHSHILSRQPSEEIFWRVKPHGVYTRRIADANNILTVVEVAASMVDLVRKNRPCFIEACTYRLKEHWGVGEDWHLGYRSREEGEKWMAKCPFKQLQKVFDEEDIPQSEIVEMEKIIKKEINEAVEFAVKSPQLEVKNGQRPSQADYL